MGFGRKCERKIKQGGARAQSLKGEEKKTKHFGMEEL